jgi:hypothetical protein
VEWILVGLGIVAGVAVLNIGTAMYIDNKVLIAAKAKGFDVRYIITKGSPEYLELLTLLKQCRARKLTVQQSADVIIERFS